MHEPPASRDAFFHDVARGLDLPPAAAADAVEELAIHLDDARAELEARGWSADEAETEAIRRLGDGRALGRDLTRARRDRRRILWAAGAAFGWALADGLRTTVFLALAATFLVTAVLAFGIMVAPMVGRTVGGMLAGASGSAVTVLFAWIGAAYMGHLLPARVAAAAHRSVRGVRPWVALGGFLLGSLGTWTAVAAELDEVLAVGLALGPVAFALAALRAPETPRVRVGVVPAIALAAVLSGPILAWSLLTAPPATASWTIDGSALGTPQVTGVVIPVAAGTQCTIEPEPGDCFAEVTVVPSAGAIPWVSYRVEIWPLMARPDGATLVPGPAPLVAANWTTPNIAPDETIISGPDRVGVAYRIPVLRHRQQIVTAIVGIDSAGGRTLLMLEPEQSTTTAWHGTILDWWAGALAGQP